MIVNNIKISSGRMSVVYENVQDKIVKVGEINPYCQFSPTDKAIKIFGMDKIKTILRDVAKEISISNIFDFYGNNFFTGSSKDYKLPEATKC